MGKISLVANKDGDLIQEILVRLPVVSLLRFKSVCKSWRTLIESPSFFDFLHTTTSNKFGSFILHAAVHFQRCRQSALIMLSSSSVPSESVSESECVSKRSVSESDSSSSWWRIGSNGVCGRCVSRSEESGSGSSSSSSSSSIRWWNTNDGLCVQCGQWSSYKVAEHDDKVFKLDSNDDNDLQQLVLKLDDLGFPSCYNFGEIGPKFIVGSCNGLICLSDTYEKNDVSLWRSVTMVDVSLWNPATGQFRILPKSITIPIDDDHLGGLLPYHLVAFGFDAETKDYKVVKVCVFEPRRSRCFCRIQVYSSSTDSWRVVEGINYFPGEPFRNQDSVLYLNGSCFFLSKFFPPNPCNPSPMNDRFIISFDLTEEIIIPIQLPNHHQGQELYLCYLGEKLALFTAECYVKVDDYTSTWVSYEDFKLVDTGCYYEEFTIWVLNYEHGGSSSSSVNRKSWRQLHWFRIERIQDEWNIPRGISNDGEFALLETQSMDGVGNKKRMKLFNLVTYQVKKKFLSCDKVLSKANAYKPSLVSIIGGNGCSSSGGG